MTLYKWSQTAAADASADPSINWAEGMSPANVNDSGRAMMAAVAKYRDDIAGAIVTGGTSTAYTVASNQQFDSLAHLDGKMVAFTPHVTNGANGSSLNVDGLGVKPILTAPGAGLPGGVLIQGTPYVALYNNTDGAFYVQGFYGNPYNVPLAAGLDYWGSATPNSSFAFPIGQAISRTTYSALFALIGTTYGGGDGSTTFNLPDKRGRVSAGFDNGNATGRLNSGGMNASALGSAGGSQSATLSTANLPPYTPTTNNITLNIRQAGGANQGQGVQAGAGNLQFGGTGAGAAPSPLFIDNPIITMNAQGGTSTPFSIVPPTIVCNYIVRII